MRIAFLHQNIYGVGGTVRAVINLANELAERHEVSIVSVFQRTDAALLTISEKVSLRPLIDMRPKGADWGNPAHNLRSELVPPDEEYFRQYSALTDERIVGFLKHPDHEVVVATRPSLNLLLAEFGAKECIRIAQEHAGFSAVPTQVRTGIAEHYGSLSASITLTAADTEHLLEIAPLDRTAVCEIPNCIPEPTIKPAASGSRTIIAAGRLTPQKRYDRMLRTFASASLQAPQWDLRIYGAGELRRNLFTLRDELGLSDTVRFMGETSQMETEWVKGDIAMVSSDWESFGMTLVEAMRAGLPVVSTDCPNGPRQIISDGVDGLLAPLNDEEALAEALVRLMTDEQLRLRMGTAALQKGDNYSPNRIAERYERLFERLATSSIPRRKSADRNFFKALRRGLVGNAHRVPVRTKVVANVYASRSSEFRVELAGPQANDFARVSLRLRSQTSETSSVDLRYCRATQSHTLTLELLGDLHDGVWDVVGLINGKVRRLTAGVIDNRALVGGNWAFESSEGYFQLVPYETLDGLASVRIWVRQAHVELSRISLNDLALQIHGVVHGVDVSNLSGATLRLFNLRQPELTLDCETVWSGTSFRAKVDAERVADERVLRSDKWGLRVVAEKIGQQIDVGRILTDINDLRHIDHFPELVVIEPDNEHYVESPPVEISVKPELDRNHDLVIHVNERSCR